jgi:TonB-dependent receptor
MSEKRFVGFPVFSMRPIPIFSILLIVIPSAVWVSPLAAQSAKSAVTGSVKDSADSALLGARVHLDPVGKETVTDGQGQFRIVDVPPGDYTLNVSYVGFAPFTKTISLQGAQTAAVEVLMQVASKTEQVLVVAERVQGEAEAINIERTADNIVQILPLKVILSLPNTNIADAVGRLPSVTLERDEGEGKYVQIRGTEPRLSNVTINGVHVPSPEANVRNIKLDVVPSDLVERIEVSKTLTPNQEGDAIGGSVNLVTRTPLEKPTFSFAAQGGYTPIQGGRSLHLFSGTLGERFGKEKKLGTLFGATYDHNNRGIDDLEPTQAIGTFNNTNFAYINSEDLRTYQYDRTRYGFEGGVDYSIKSGSTIYLRGLFSDFHDYGSTFVYTPNAGNIVSNSGSQTVFDNTGNMAYREYIRRPDQQIFSVETGGNHDFTSTVVAYNFAISRAHNNGGQDFATTNFSGPSKVQFGLSQSDPYRPKLTPQDGTNVYDPSSYLITRTVLPNYRTSELDYQGNVSLARRYTAGPFFGTFETGFLIRDAHKNQYENDQFFDATGNYAMNQVLSNVTNPGYYDKSFTYGPITDYSKIQSLLATQLQNGFTPNLDKNHIVSDPASWDTRERVTAGYLMNAITFGKWKVVGGLRIEGTNENFHANQVTLNAGAYVGTNPITGTSGYVNYLPSVQVQYLIEKNTNIRLSYGRGISRPNFQDLVPSVQADPNTSPKSLQVGNPALLPTKANNYDLLVEHFFQPLGILQAGYFYKALTNPIYSTVSFVSAGDPNFPGYLRQQSINGPSAHISGFEIAWQQRLSRLPWLLNGLGVSANYSYATSRVSFPANFSSAVSGGQGRIDHPSLQRQAPNTWNFDLTYDKARFSFRMGVSHNDANVYAYAYVHDPTNPNVDRDPILGLKGPLADQYLYAHTQVDMQGSYRFYRGMQAVVSGLNLTNEVFGFYSGSPIYPNQREYYQPTVIVGVRWVSGVER